MQQTYRSLSACHYDTALFYGQFAIELYDNWLQLNNNDIYENMELIDAAALYKHVTDGARMVIKGDAIIGVLGFFSFKMRIDWDDEAYTNFLIDIIFPNIEDA